MRQCIAIQTLDKITIDCLALISLFITRNDITTIEMVIGSVITDWYIDTEKISATTEHAEDKDNNLNPEFLYVYTESADSKYEMATVSLWFAKAIWYANCG